MLLRGNILGLFLLFPFLFSEPVMKLLLILCLASLFTLPVLAARRVGEAQVRPGKNDLPCFTIAEREEKRSGSPDFQSVTVTANQRILWRMSMPRERTFPLAFNMCIPYGGRGPALPQTPAAALESGTVYTVHLDTRPGKGSTEPLRYAARFCLARQADGKTAVHQLGAIERPTRGLPDCRDKDN
jgi:hypothetical protein